MGHVAAVTQAGAGRDLGLTPKKLSFYEIWGESARSALLGQPRFLARFLKSRARGLSPYRFREGDPMNNSKTQYETPTLDIVASFESLTQGASSGTATDAVFPVGTSMAHLTFS